MFGEPAQPAAERAVVFVDGDDARAWGAVEGAVGEDEAEGGEGFYQAAGLELEDFCCYAAAVEAEDSGEGEVGWVGWCVCHCGCGCRCVASKTECVWV